ncbi:IS4 family transposase [Amphibacillus sp. Q70]|uniref:IS4 family transposase n=1 Tax=Amphibacillus sp. Q70 TaxID=3453416 RepID=UPI003F848842
MDKNTIKSTISEVLKLIDEQTLLDLSHVENLDKYVKKLTAYRFFKLMIIAQLCDTDSLTSVSKQTKDKADLKKQIGFESISTSQLSRKLSELPSEMFENIFRFLTKKIQVKMSYHLLFLRDITRLNVIDSSTMSMSLSQYPWATFRKTKAGVRLHLKVIVTKDHTIPDQAKLLPAIHSDRSQMDELIDRDPDAIYLFDRGYMDYKQFEKLCLSDIQFVTRLKKNADIEVLSEQVPDPDQLIFKDQDVYLGNETSGTKMIQPLRLIETEDTKGNSVTIVTNCFGLSAKEIGDLYRYRWKIETFFKWMKQHLKIKTFYGKSQNAVYNQIWMALITYCLTVLIQDNTGFKGRLLTIKKTLKNLLFESYETFIKALFRPPTRTSKGRRKYDYEHEFQILMKQYSEGEVEHLDTLDFDPLFV